MKKIIAIFFSVFVLVAAVPMDVLCAGACPKISTKGNNDNEDIIIGNDLSAGKWFFHCDNDDCKPGWYVLVVGDFFLGGESCAGNSCAPTSIYSFVCESKRGKSWEHAANAIPWCGDALGSFVNNADFKIKTSDGSFRTTSCSSGGCGVYAEQGDCKGWYCKNGFHSNGSECVLDTSAQDACTDSGGTWSGSECQCSDGNGLVQSSDKKTCICKTDGGYSWVRDPSDSKKCIDPGSACNTSGGHWDGTTCDCSALAPEKTSDGTQCVDDSFFQPCEDSGGQWNGTECTNCDASRGLTPAPGNKTCKCINSNEEYSSTTDRCVLTEQALCEKTGGVWDGTNCDCDISGKNIKKKDGSVPVQCECISPDYEWNADMTQGCKLSPEAENRKENFEKSKEACEAWGGTWSPGTWESPDGVDVTKWKCKCPNRAGVVQATAVSCKCDIIKGYQETAPNTCTQTTCADLQTKCNAVRDASYKTLTAHDGQKYCECVCDDEKNKAYNYSKNKCEAITNICDLIDDAILDRYGNCVCKSNWLPPVRGKCPSSTSSGSASGGGASPVVTVSPQQIAQAKQNVSDVYDDLKSISDGFGRSHWKTASGNFNGARLASDSIAGVVLGTVGGVVTSNVIKKNQVKGGFESLQCTVGGQLVADFGDQFQVGIR